MRDLQWPFYVEFSLLRTALSLIRIYTYRRAGLYNIFVVSRHQQRCAEANRDPQSIADLRKDCGSVVDEKLRSLLATSSEPQHIRPTLLLSL